MKFRASIEGYENCTIIDVSRPERQGEAILAVFNGETAQTAQAFRLHTNGELVPGKRMTLSAAQRVMIEKYDFDYLAALVQPAGNYPDAWRISAAKQHQWNDHQGS